MKRRPQANGRNNPGSTYVQGGRRHPLASWRDTVEDDGAGEASEPALQRRAEGVVTAALRAFGRAFSDEDQIDQLRAELLLEVARAMRTEARRGYWTRLPTGERRQLRDALLILECLAQTGVPLPVA